MTKTGTDLAADLSKLYEAGTYLVPEVGRDIGAAYTACPVSITSICYRGGGLGVPDNGPAGGVGQVLDELNSVLMGTRDTMTDLAQALLWLSKDFDHTDTACAHEFKRKQAVVDQVHAHDVDA